MATRQERTTTDFAESEFHRYLAANDLGPALICVSGVVQHRLKLLLVFRLTKDGGDWKRVYENLQISFGVAVNLCESLGLISESTAGQIRRLRKRRNPPAHPTRPWAMSESESEEARRLCELAISFLRSTDEVGASEEPDETDKQPPVG